MARRKGFSFLRQYLRVQLWLRERCDRLSPKARKRLVYGISAAYLVCSLAMIAQCFLPQQEEPQLPIPTNRYIDSSIRSLGADSIGERLSSITQQMIQTYGQ